MPGVLAAKSIALNEAGEQDAYDTLVDLEKFVRPILHEPPDGYDTIDAFNAALNDTCHVAPDIGHRALKPHDHERQADGQFQRRNQGTDRGAGDADRKRDRTICGRCGRCRCAPNRRPPAGKYELSIWGTVLEGEGFQAPHIHPSGWLSGVYYPQVPKVVEDEDNKYGWIEFGQPGPEYHFSKKTELRLIKPEPGIMVMFPSYMFHRTIPFQSDETRISIAFDVVPV